MIKKFLSLICLNLLFFLLTSGSSGTQWSLVCGGDLMLNSIHPSTKPLTCIEPIIKSAHIRYANLEIPLTNSQNRTKRKTPEELKRRDQYVLKAHPNHIHHLKETGFNVFSLANNHIMDYGQEGLFESKQLASQLEILTTGAGNHHNHASEPAVLKVPHGLNIGFISYLAFIGPKALHKCSPATENTPGIASLNLGGKFDDLAKEKIRQIVLLAKKKCQFLVVALHWGIERQTLPTWYQVAVGRAFIDYGADMILGSHPHVLQGAEIYQGKPIFYSLGNLISSKTGQTALFKLNYTHHQYNSLLMYPIDISGGKLSRTNKTASVSKAESFLKLCKMVNSKYPHSNSKIPTIYLGD